MKKRWSRLIPAFALTVAFLLTDAPVPAAAAVGDELKIRENIYVDGMTVGGMTEAEALAALERREESLKDVELTLTSEYGNVDTTLGDLGYYGDVEAAVREAVGYGNTGSVLKRYKEQHSGEEGKKIEIHRSISDTRVKTVVDKALSKVFDGSANAKLVKKSETEVQVIPGNDSVRLDAEASGKKINLTLSADWDHESFQVPLVLVDDKDGEGTKELSYITDLLGTYTTEFGSGDSGRNQNIARAAELMNGKIVYPGDEVSTYYTIDPIEESNGYAMAGVFVNNEVVQGIGGGVCQMSTTLYNALLWSEIEIVKRDYHGLPVAYVPLSYDATMAGGYLDLIFRNNLEHPFYIDIDCNVDEGYIKVNIYGHEYRDPKRTISFDNNIVEKIEVPEEPEYTEDPEMAPGTEEVTAEGKTGYKTELWKYVYYDGELQDSVLINRSVYSATPKKIKRGKVLDTEATENASKTEDTETTEESSEDTEKKKEKKTEKKKDKKTEKKKEKKTEEPDTEEQGPGGEEPEEPETPEAPDAPEDPDESGQAGPK